MILNIAFSVINVCKPGIMYFHFAAYCWYFLYFSFKKSAMPRYSISQYFKNF